MKKISPNYQPTTLRRLVLLAACGGNNPDRRVANVSEPTPIPTAVVPNEPTYTVERGDVVYATNLRGRIAPISETSLAFDRAGEVSELTVERGDTILEGAEIARLDTSSLERELLLVSEESFVNRLSPILSDEIYSTAWYLVLDGSKVDTQFDDALRERQLTPWDWEEPYANIAQEQTRPQRQGLFGLLSIGFLAASLLTVMGFFMYSLYSFRRRFIELGILRAVGLSQGQMLTFIACEMGFLILTGLGLGTALGAWVSQLFVPFLQIDTEASDLIPPYLVETAWTAVSQITILFILLFLFAMLILALSLRRMKIFQAVKLGETA